MPTDLPFYNKSDGSNNKRPKQNKRYILAFALIGICFIFYLNARLTTTVNGPQDGGYTNEIEKDTNGHLPPINHLPNTNTNTGMTNNNKNNINNQLEEQDNTVHNSFPTQSTHSNTHKPIQPFDETSDDIKINDSNHYNYLVVVASNANNLERRRLIRDKYFNLRDNLLPCMHYNSDVYYKFWVYGGAPTPDTPLRRQYEAEKMEWNDLIDTDTSKTFNQANILQWAESELKDQGITYDYLILQDVNTFIQLDTMKRELDSGVISDNTDSPVTINTDAPTNFVWGNFRSDKTDKGAVVIGKRAVQLALMHRKEIESVATVKGESIITSMYKYYQTYVAKLPVAIAANPEQEAIERGKLVPEFVREDGPDGTHRFIRWENNVESVHSEDIVVYEVYQDLEFSELARQTRLKPVHVCYRKSTVTHEDQATNQPIDDDESGISDLLQENRDEDENDSIENEIDQQNQQQLIQHSKQYDASSIAVVTSSFIYDACMEPSATRAAMNKRAYALKHGYSFVARSAEFAQEALRGERKTVWGKIDVIEKVLPKYEWIFWLDMDAVIMDQTHSLETLLDEVKRRYPQGVDTFDKEIDLVIARPQRDPMINAGVFLMRNTPWSMQFLRDVQKTTSWYNKGSSYEQGAMWDVMRLPENKDKVFLLDRDDHTFNTFPKKYIPGDFVVHFAPDKCPNDATVRGLNGADRILNGEVINRVDLLSKEELEGH